MKKKFKLENLDCAHCAQKMEDGIKKIEGVIDCSVSFFSQKLMIEADDSVFEDVLGKAEAVVKKIHADTEIVK